MAKVKKTQKNKTPKKGMLGRLFGSSAKKQVSKKSASPAKKKTTASPKKVVKAPEAKKITPKKPTKKPVSKPNIEKKRVAATIVKAHPPAPIKPPKPQPPKEFVVESSYTPEPFKGSSFILKPHKILTSEGWKRFVEEES